MPSHAVGTRSRAPAIVFVGLLTLGACSSPRPPGFRAGALAISQSQAFVVSSDGDLWGWGIVPSQDYLSTVLRASPMRLGSGFTSVTGKQGSARALKKDGTLWTVTQPSWAPPVQEDTGILWISSRGSHTAIVRTDGALWESGAGLDGRLDIEGFPVPLPAPVQIGTGFVFVAAGVDHSLGIKSDGTLWAWGQNQLGQLGDGTTETRWPEPVQVGTGFVSAAAGRGHSIGLKTDRTLWTWGDNDHDSSATERPRHNCSRYRSEPASRRSPRASPSAVAASAMDSRSD
jgi:regulator of chromosome condensation (RCC1) repeat-containing protein